MENSFVNVAFLRLFVPAENLSLYQEYLIIIIPICDTNEMFEMLHDKDLIPLSLSLVEFGYSKTYD